jgi:hypothetical protein
MEWDVSRNGSSLRGLSFADVAEESPLGVDSMSLAMLVLIAAVGETSSFLS